MTAPREIRVPDIGTDEKVDVVEVLVASGDEVAVDDGLVTLESDKASMDVPAEVAGKVVEIKVKVGDQVGEGDLLLLVEASAGSTAETAKEAKPETPARAATTAPASPPPPEVEKPASPAVSPAAAPDADLHAEVLVLGSGPGGYTAAFRAADLGKKVVLVERHGVLGGVCLNVGCIPSKALLHVAKVVDEAATASRHGVHFEPPRVELDELRGWKDGVVSRLTKGIAGMADKRGVKVVHGEGRLTGPHALTVTGGDGDGDGDGERTISFDQAIVAAGSRVVEIPGVPYDDPRVMDSTGALELADVPERLLLIGGGVIGLEMAMVYGSLGSKLTVVELLDGLVPGCDRDLVKPLERRLKRQLKAKIFLGTKVTRIEAGDGELTAFFEGKKAPESQGFDRVLVAVGRRPNGDRVGAEAAGLAVDERGFLPVDRQMRTNVPHIFAIGDVAGDPMLAHKATHEGKVAAEVAAGEKSSFDARVIPAVAYTDPEIAWVGLTETEAAANGTAYEVGSFPWSASGRSLAMGNSAGVTKLLFDPATKRVLGGGIVGPNAGDLISEIAPAIEMDCEAADIGLTVHPHPTLSETVAFAAEAFEGTITDLYLPKK